MVFLVFSSYVSHVGYVSYGPPPLQLSGCDVELRQLGSEALIVATLGSGGLVTWL